MMGLIEKRHIPQMRDFLVLVFGDAYLALAEKHLAAMFADDLSRIAFLAAWQDDRIVASAAASEAAFTVNTWGIGWVGVHQDVRGHGMGRRIMAATEQHIRRQITRSSTVLLSVYPAIAPFYEKQGYSGTTTDSEGSPFLAKTVLPQ